MLFVRFALMVLFPAAALAQPVLSVSDSALVDLTRLGRSWRYEIRYATPHNAFGVQLYEAPRPMLVREAAEALVRADSILNRSGLTLLIYDAYRPWRVTKALYGRVDSSLRAFVAHPDRGSRHNRGCAVDVGLADLKSGRPLEMPTDYDDFSERAAADWPGADAVAAGNRALLRSAMEQAGFDVLANEWWHFDWRGWRKYPLLDVPLKP